MYSLNSQIVKNEFSRFNHLEDKIEVHSSNLNKIELSKALELALEWCHGTHNNQKKIIFIGNGGSASIASHMAIDYWKNGGLRATSFNEASLLTCIGNDYGYPEVFSKPLEMHGQAGDLLFAISSSGKSINILNAVEAACKKDIKVITLSSFEENNPLRKKGDLNFYVPSMEYGVAEISHLIICHTILDISCKLRKSSII